MVKYSDFKRERGKKKRENKSSNVIYETGPSTGQGDLQGRNVYPDSTVKQQRQTASTMFGHLQVLNSRTLVKRVLMCLSIVLHILGVCIKFLHASLKFNHV